MMLMLLMYWETDANEVESSLPSSGACEELQHI